MLEGGLGSVVFHKNSEKWGWSVGFCRGDSSAFEDDKVRQDSRMSSRRMSLETLRATTKSVLGLEMGLGLAILRLPKGLKSVKQFIYIQLNNVAQMLLIA